MRSVRGARVLILAVSLLATGASAKKKKKSTTVSVSALTGAPVIASGSSSTCGAFTNEALRFTPMNCTLGDPTACGGRFLDHARIAALVGTEELLCELKGGAPHVHIDQRCVHLERRRLSRLAALAQHRLIRREARKDGLLRATMGAWRGTRRSLASAPSSIAKWWSAVLFVWTQTSHHPAMGM